MHVCSGSSGMVGHAGQGQVKPTDTGMVQVDKQGIVYLNHLTSTRYQPGVASRFRYCRDLT